MLAKRILAIEESATLAVSEKAAQLRAKGIDVISFSAGEPDFDTPAHIKEAAVRALEQGFTKYTTSSGIPKLREAIARKLERDNNLHYPAAAIVVSNGAKHSLYNALHALVDDDDEVLIPSPYWTSYPEMVKSVGGKPVFMQTSEEHGFRLTPDVLKRHLTPRSKMLIMNSPSNPTGGVYTEQEFRALGEVLKPTKVFVLSDEVYEKMMYGQARHVAPAAISPDMFSRTVTVNSVSKVYAMTGWRIGYAAGPAEVMDAIGRLQSQMTSNPNSIAQYAALAAFEGDQSCVTKMIQEYQRRRDVVMQHLRKHDRLTCVEPNGAFYIFPNVSALYGHTYDGQKITDSFTLSTLLLEGARIAVVPGAAFGSDRHIRFSFATSMEKINEGFHRLDEFLKKVK